MKIQPTNGSTITFKSGYPTFGSNGHLSMTTNKGNDNISFGGSPWNRHHMTVFKGHSMDYKVPPEGGILIHSHDKNLDVMA